MTPPSDLDAIAEGLEIAKRFIGAEIVISGFGQETYSKVLLALAALDRLRTGKAEGG